MLAFFLSTDVLLTQLVRTATLSQGLGYGGAYLTLPLTAPVQSDGLTAL